VQFTASATTSGSIEVNLGMAAEPYTSYLANTYKADLSSSPRTFSFTFTMGENTDANSRLEFNAGLADIDWTIDNISLRVDNGNAVLTGAKLTQPASALSVAGRTAAFVLPEADRVALDLLDLQGKLVAHVAAGRFAAGVHRISLPTLPAGAYLLALDSGRGRSLLRWCAVR
jgi:hypothetical protein